MPTVFRYKGVRFYFYSNEGNPREPVHIHASAPNGEAKFWLSPDVHVASSIGFDRRTLSELVLAVEARRDDIERAWNEYFR
jgi:hypothetical protein